MKRSTFLVLFCSLWATEIFISNALEPLFSEPSQMSQFIAEDELRVAHFRADLVLDINLTSFTENADLACRAASSLATNRSSKFQKALRNRYVAVCEDDKRAWAGTMDFVTGASATGDRDPRFLFTTIFTSLVGGFFGSLFNEARSSSNTDAMLKQNREDTVQMLRPLENTAQANREAIRHLAQIVAKDEETTFMAQQFSQSTLFVISALMAQSREMGRVSHGIENLLLTHKLSPSLIAPNVLAGKLAHLREQAAMEGRSLAISDEHEIFQCEASFGTSSEHIFRVIIHIPMADSQEIYHLYRFVHAPLLVNGELMVVSTDETHLAVRQDKEMYFLPSTLDLSRCEKFRGFLTCSMFDGSYSREYPSCLWGIFSSNSEMVLRTCSLAKMPSRSTYWSLLDNRFWVFHHTPLKLSVECDGKPRDSLFFNGSREVTIPRGCVARNSYFSLSSPDVRAHEKFLLEVDPLTLTPSNFTFGHPADDFSKNLAKVKVHDPSWPRKMTPRSSHLSWFAVALGTLALTLLVLLVFSLYRKRSSLLAQARERWATYGPQNQDEEEIEDQV